MKRIIDKLNAGQVLVSDGAWGTLLQEKGAKPGECMELLSITRPADVLEVASGYIAAGADIVLTNSFGANRIKLASYGLEARAAELNFAAASISREAAGPDKHVMGSIGPTGKLLIMGDVSEQELYDAFAEQATALEKGGADAACIETMAAADEAVLAVRATRENTSLDIACTFTYEKTVRGDYRTMMGLAPADGAAAALDAGADIVGANCGNGFEGMIPITAEIKKASPKALILIHANAGMPVSLAGKTVFPETPEMMVARVPELIRAGANIIGGCCGTTPAHIEAIVRSVRQASSEFEPEFHNPRMLKS